MTGAQAALVLLAVTGLGCLLMITFVIERKLHRDRREWLSGSRRDRVLQGMLSGDGDAIRAAAVRSLDEGSAQIDFAIAAAGTVDSLDPASRRVLDDSVRLIGLPGKLVRQLGSRHPVERGRAVFLLGELRLAEAGDALPPLLYDPDPDVRLVACAELGGIKTEEAAFSLISALIAAALPVERIIERLAGSWAIPSMVAVLEDGVLARSLAPDDGEVSAKWRPAVARAMGVAADIRAELTLARMLDSEQTEERVAAARALGPSGSPASVPVLIAALDDPAWEVRAQAAKSLGSHPDHSSVSALERRLSDEAWWVRSNAADALATIGVEGVEALERALSHSDRFARERAQEALTLHQLAAA